MDCSVGSVLLPAMYVRGVQRVEEALLGGEEFRAVEDQERLVLANNAPGEERVEDTHEAVSGRDDAVHPVVVRRHAPDTRTDEIFFMADRTENAP